MSRTLSRRTFLSALSLGATAAHAQGTPATHADRIDAAREYQVIENFGASDCWRTERLIAWPEASRQRVADLLFSPDKGIGLSCWRFNIGAGINPRITEPWRTAETFELTAGKYDWTRQAGQRWFLRAAKSRGVPQFLAFSLSGTSRMTRNGLTYASRGRWTTNLRPGMEMEYARYLADIVEHFHGNADPEERIAFNYLSPVNEPQWDWIGRSQEGDRASNEDIRRLVRPLGAELRRRRLPTEIVAPESGNLPDMSSLNRKMTTSYGAQYGNYFDELAGDPSISEMLSKRLCYHSYWSDRLDGPLVAHRRDLGRKLASYPGWKLWQTEYCVMEGPEGEGGPGRDLTMKTALDVARVIHLDLTVVGVSAWQWWTAISEADYKDGLIYTDWKKPGDPETVYPSRLLWALGNFSRFVRPGMVRVTLNGDRHDVRGLMASAFRNRATGEIVAVYVNVSGDEHTVHLSFANAPAPVRIAPYVTSDREGDELKKYPALGTDAPVRVPARSVVTLVMSAAK
jgi:hypothetical protein